MPCESVDVKIIHMRAKQWVRGKIRLQEEAGNYKGDHKKLCAVYFMGLN